MAVRKNPSLSDILSAFRSARTSEKTANEEECVPGSPCVEPAAEPPIEAGATIEDLAQAAQILEETGEHADQLKGAVPEAEERVVDAAEALKDVADEFIAEHTENLAKEAQVFGQIFAASCMEEMNKTAALQNTAEEAYTTTTQTLMSAAEDNQMNKIACAYDEAYRITMAKLAGFDDPEEMEEAAGQALDPEDMAAIVNAQQDAEAADELTEDEIAELAEALAGPDGEIDPEDVEEAVAMIQAQQEAEDEEALPKVASEAYWLTRQQLGY